MSVLPHGTGSASGSARRALPGLRLDPWQAVAAGLVALLSLPVIAVFSFVLHPAGEIWQHLARTVLQDYVVNSLVLMLGVAAGTLLLGVPTAWLTTMCRFPGRGALSWALLLPLAIPPYIIAYTYTGMLDVSGPVQETLRELFGWRYGEYWFPDIRSRQGAALMLSLVLYPYVYLLARAAFLEQSAAMFDASRTLGRGPGRTFLAVSLPIARPAIVVGLSLALMETLADYGTVKYFGVSTFTTGIFRTWFGFGDGAAAAQLAALLMTFVFVLVILERRSRHRARYFGVGSGAEPLQMFRLRGWRAALAVTACTLPLVAGFALPVLQLAAWTARTASRTVDASFVTLVLNSAGLAVTASALAMVTAVFLAYTARLRPSRAMHGALRIAGMGYAVPGTVIAVGVMLPFGWFDRNVDNIAREYLGISTGLLLSGTLVALVFAYLVRFLTISLHTIEAGLGKIRPCMDDAARTMGHTPLTVLARVHVPMMRGSLLTALLIVFVEVLKELPATLVLRPFNFNTLAVRTYELASDERLADASSAALAIVLTGIVPVIVLSRSIARARRRADPDRP